MSKLDELKTEEAKIKADIDLLTSKLSVINGQINKTMSNMRYYKKKKIHVSDHALIRYIEREYGLDVEALKKEMISENVLIGAQLTKCGKFSIRSGLMAVVQNNVIVTTYEV